VLGCKRAPEFEDWLAKMDLVDAQGRLVPPAKGNRLLLEAGHS
jgi:ethanolamine ammonia-lyase large subunit